MNRAAWMQSHPYLHPVADLLARVEAATVEVSIPKAPIPNWLDYARDFRAGVPLLSSTSSGIDLSLAEDAVFSLVEKLTPPSVVSSADPGLFRCLAWVVLARYLSDVVAAFARWRDEERWLRNYCPTCGELPAMAQLVGKDPGRLRMLSCGCCRTRWRYRRTGCPFCDSQHDHRLAVVAVQGEAGLRIDYCETCGGYLKTYDGEGSESLLLADWTSLHLDVIARERGLKRLASSLYQI